MTKSPTRSPTRPTGTQQLWGYPQLVPRELMSWGHSNSGRDDNRSDFDFDSGCEGLSVQDDINGHVSPGAHMHCEPENAFCGDAPRCRRARGD